MLLVIYLFNYDSSKSTFFMLFMAFDVLLSTVFVKQITILHFLQYNDHKNILPFALYFQMYFSIVLHHGDIIFYSILNICIKLTLSTVISTMKK